MRQTNDRVKLTTNYDECAGGEGHAVLPSIVCIQNMFCWHIFVTVRGYFFFIVSLSHQMRQTNDEGKSSTNYEECAWREGHAVLPSIARVYTECVCIYPSIHPTRNF